MTHPKTSEQRISYILLGTFSQTCIGLKADPAWFLTEDGSVEAPNVIAADFERPDPSDKIPVLDWLDVPAFLDGEEGEPLEYHSAQALEISGRRFRVLFKGNSMSGDIEAGELIDCGEGLEAQDEDIVLAYHQETDSLVVRRIIPSKITRKGIVRAKLVATNTQYPDMDFDATKGDEVLAVVFDVIKPIRKIPKRKRPTAKMAA